MVEMDAWKKWKVNEGATKTGGLLSSEDDGFDSKKSCWQWILGIQKI